MGEAYKGTNITGERVVNHSRMKLNDALIEFHWNFALTNRKPLMRVFLNLTPLICLLRFLSIPTSALKKVY